MKRYILLSVLLFSPCFSYAFEELPPLDVEGAITSQINQLDRAFYSNEIDAEFYCQQIGSIYANYKNSRTVGQNAYSNCIATKRRQEADNKRLNQPYQTQ